MADLFIVVGFNAIGVLIWLAALAGLVYVRGYLRERCEKKLSIVILVLVAILFALLLNSNSATHHPIYIVTHYV